LRLFELLTAPAAPAALFRFSAFGRRRFLRLLGSIAERAGGRAFGFGRPLGVGNCADDTIPGVGLGGKRRPAC
jgi:hypothetical protein